MIRDEEKTYLYVVMASRGDGYHLDSEVPVLAFFSGQKAEELANSLNDSKNLGVYYEAKRIPLATETIPTREEFTDLENE